MSQSLGDSSTVNSTRYRVRTQLVLRHQEVRYTPEDAHALRSQLRTHMRITPRPQKTHRGQVPQTKAALNAAQDASDSAQYVPNCLVSIDANLLVCVPTRLIFHCSLT